jgi:hypothetical protein
MKRLFKNEIEAVSGGNYTLTVVFDVPPTAETYMSFAVNAIAANQIRNISDFQNYINNMITIQKANYNEVTIQSITYSKIVH